MRLTDSAPTPPSIGDSSPLPGDTAPRGTDESRAPKRGAVSTAENAFPGLTGKRRRTESGNGVAGNAAEGSTPRQQTRVALMPASANFAPHSARGLDLHIVGRTGSAGIQAPDLDHAPLRLGGLVRTIADFTEDPEFKRSEGASTQPARYLRDNATQTLYRCKLNENRPRNTFSDVVMPQMMVHAYGFDDVPQPVFLVDNDNRLGKGSDAVWVASPMVSGFKDWGPFLVESGARHVEPHNRDAYAAHLRDHADASRSAQELRKTPDIAGLMTRFPKGGFDKLDQSGHETLQPLRDRSRDALQRQDRMLELLPDEFNRALASAFYLGEVPGNWDLANHERANTGFVIDDEGVHAPTVDWGNTAPVAGFGGNLKRDSQRAANQPARVDEPYARVPDALTPSGYMQDFLRDDDLKYENPSKTFGAIGGIPRAAVLGGLQRPVIESEREFEPASRTRHDAPDAALAVAWQLSRAPGTRVERVVEQIFALATGENLPASVTQLFSEKTTGYANAGAFAKAQNDRTKALIARAKEGRQLERWVEKNPERAAEISQRVARALRGEPKDPRDALRA